MTEMLRSESQSQKWPDWSDGFDWVWPNSLKHYNNWACLLRSDSDTKSVLTFSCLSISGPASFSFSWILHGLTKTHQFPPRRRGIEIFPGESKTKRCEGDGGAERSCTPSTGALRDCRTVRLWWRGCWRHWSRTPACTWSRCRTSREMGQHRTISSRSQAVPDPDLTVLLQLQFAGTGGKERSPADQSGQSQLRLWGGNHRETPAWDTPGSGWCVVPVRLWSQHYVLLTCCFCSVERTGGRPGTRLASTCCSPVLPSRPDSWRNICRRRETWTTITSLSFRYSPTHGLRGEPE